jgi:hypothetical protein
MKKLTVLCTALAASVLCATPLSLPRTAAHANERGRCEQKGA